MRGSRVRLVSVATGCLFVISAAGAGGPVRDAAADPAGAEAKTLTVFAAASLVEPFGAVAESFRARHPRVEMVFNFAGSQQLAAQIIEGAPADVFASANREQMSRVLASARAAIEPRTFARNALAIAVEPGNPQGIRGLADLARDGLIVVLAAEEVPAGRYAREALGKAGVTVRPASLETDVRQVISRVALGEADAGIVYRSDLLAAGTDVAGVEIAAEHNVEAAYPIAVLSEGSAGELGQAFVELVLSDEGRRILAEAGFSLP
jgi:molybdate transport system substrate-binding protein